MKKRMKSLLPTDIVTEIVNVGNRFITCFHVKHVTEFKHSHDIIYQSRCPVNGCNEHYLEETARRISGRVLDQA